MKTVLFIQAGGTIDKNYMASSGNYGYNFEISEPAVKSILERIKPDFRFEILTVCRKDSLDMTDLDRQKMLKKCRDTKAEHIIITHGTDRFIKTAKVLDEIGDKVIVLTGSMKPEKFKNSDAEFNIGTAVGAINFLKNGVYVAMSGMVYSWKEYQKLKKAK
ncbi:MAG: asparaginase [Candidatus Buchananbacteria bacterium]|nr:asparaginase [Candidatus Buchananbacteria bacterium]